MQQKQKECVYLHKAFRMKVAFLCALSCVFSLSVPFSYTYADELFEDIDVITDSATKEPLPLIQEEKIKATGEDTQNISISEYEETIERMVFDVYFANKFIGTAIGNFTNDWIELDNPEDITDQISGLKTPDQVAKLITGKLASNGIKTVNGVGRVEALPRFFRVNIDVEPEQVLSQKLDERTIVLPREDFSLNHRMKINTSSDFNPQTEERSSLNHNTIISQGAWRSQLSGTLVKKQAYDLNTLDITHDVGTASYHAGMLTTGGLRFASGQPIWGVSAETNTRLLRGQSIVRSSPIEIYVPSRSKVQMFRKGAQLIYSEVLDFGLQEIDTSNFPDGSYEVEIVITEYSGDTTREVRQFSKSGNVLAGDKPIYKFTAGLVRNNLDVMDTFSAQGSVRWKWNETNELASTLLVNDGSTIFEQALYGTYNAYTYSFNAQLSDSGATAVAGSMRYSANPWNFTLNAERTLTGHIPREDAVDETEYLARDIALYSTSLNYVAGNMNYQFSAQRSDTKGSAEPTYSYGPTISWGAYSANGHNLRFVYNYTRSNTGINASAMANYRYNINDNWRSDSSISRRRSGSKDLIDLSQKFNYNKTYDTSSLSGNVGRNYTHGETDLATDTAAIRYSGKSVDWALGGQRLSGDTRPQAESVVDFNAQTNYVYTKGKNDTQGVSQLSGESKGDSMFIAKLEGNASDTDMRVMVDGRPRAVVKVGESVNISLSPYKTYEISIAPNNDMGLVQYDTSSESFTVYPGNIATKTWQVKKSILLIGRLVDMEGEVIAWKPIKGLNGLTATDGAGNFQLEIAGNEMPYIESKDRQCTFAMPQIQTENYFLHVGDVLCL